MKKYYSLEKQGKSAEILIFGDITSWPFLESDVSSYNLEREIQALDDVDEINVHINSYGGEVNEALAITNTLLRHPAKVTTYVDGFACSAATIIFMAGEKRVMSEFSNFLVHPAYSWIQGNADEMRKEADNLDAITDQSVKAYMSRISKSEEELRDLMKEERFMTPEEVLDWGFATEIEKLADDKKPEQSVKKLIYQKVQDTVLNADDNDLEDISAQLDVIQALCEDIKSAVTSDDSGEDTDDPDKEPDNPDEDPEEPEEDPDDPDKEPDEDEEDDPDEEPEPDKETDNQTKEQEEAPNMLERFFNAF